MRTYNTQMQVLSDEDIRRRAPSVFAEGPRAATTSERYRFYPTSMVLAGLRDNGFLPVRAEQTRAVEGGRDYARHMIRFRHSDYLQHHELNEEIPEVVMMNAHDGSSSYQLSAGIYRLVCLNGMVVGEDRFMLRVKHSGRESMVREVIEASFEIIKSFPEVIGTTQEMRGQLVTLDQAKAYARAALTLRWGVNDQGVTVAPIEPERLLQRRRDADTIDNVWGTLNVVQENMMRGGLKGRTQTNKPTKTRPINSVVEDMRINKGLWVLARELGKLAA